MQVQAPANRTAALASRGVPGIASARLDQVCMVARDFAVEFDFFKRVLGLAVAAGEGDRWARFRIGNTGLLLVGAGVHGFLRAGAQIPLLGVVDVSTAVTALAARGAIVTEVPLLADLGPVVVLRSTAGNVLLLYAVAGGTETG